MRDGDFAAVEVQGSETARAVPLREMLGDEGFRLFFPLAAIHAALWPFLWIAVQGYGLAGATVMTPGVWHMHEMVFGAWGAALIGFLTTAFPEWTGAARLRGRSLFALAALWGVARVVGLLGADLLTPLAALCDLGWLVALIAYGLRVSWVRRTDRLLAFVGWLVALAAAEAATRWAMLAGDPWQAAQAARAGGLVFLGLLGIALARVTVPVTNLVLDPTEATSPFRPHPGRLNLASGLVAVALLGELAGLSESVTGWLWIAAGAGFMDRVADSFVGRAAFRIEIAVLWLASALAGAGLLWRGAVGLGLAQSDAGALHLALMGGLGVAVLGIISIAGLFHAGRSLPFPRRIAAALAALLGAVAFRLAPELAPLDPFPAHAAASILWAAGFGIWLSAYVPIILDRGSYRGEGGA